MTRTARDQRRGREECFLWFQGLWIGDEAHRKLAVALVDAQERAAHPRKYSRTNMRLLSASQITTLRAITTALGFRVQVLGRAAKRSYRGSGVAAQSSSPQTRKRKEKGKKKRILLRFWSCRTVTPALNLPFVYCAA